jgi:hypothetical protein
MDLEDFEEIGGRCDVNYICDICEESERSYSEDEVNFTRIFRVADEDVCEYCLRKVLRAKTENIIEGLVS